MDHTGAVAAVAFSAAVALLRYRRHRRRRTAALAATSSSSSIPQPRGGGSTSPSSSLASCVTVCVFTSASPSNPSCALIESVLQSFRLVPGLGGCRKLIVCDGAQLHATKCKFRSGRVDEAASTRYDEYKMELRARVGAGEGVYSLASMLELPDRHGFGFAVREALNHVTTSHVLIVQHDRTFMRPVHLKAVLRAMLKNGDRIGYVLLPTTSTKNYSEAMRHRLAEKGVKDRDITRLQIDVPSSADACNACLLPCLQFYDSTHLATVKFYLTTVFGRGLVKRGGFIEDKFGQSQFRDIVEHGISAHAKWATWLLEDGLGRAVGHLDGSKYSGEYSMAASTPWANRA